MIKPSWVISVTTVLASFGPKLNSDQWHTLGSLYLPVTFICLWSKAELATDNDQHHHEIMHLTMLLFSAIAIASSHVTSEGHAQKYTKFMVEYCQELKCIFPSYVCKSNHHMVLHVADFLRLYRLVQGWWAFPFERIIGMLQQISTKYKPGWFDSLRMLYLD